MWRLDRVEEGAENAENLRLGNEQNLIPLVWLSWRELGSIEERKDGGLVALIHRRFLPSYGPTSRSPTQPHPPTPSRFPTDFFTHSQEGEHDTVDYRVHSLDHNEERISLWHELPLFAVDDDARPTGALNFICEMYVVLCLLFEAKRVE